MKSAWVVVALVCVVLTSAGWAQLVTPRAMGMGGASVGVADDAAAWIQNPAGLGALSMACPDEEKEWANDAILSYSDAGAGDGVGLTWSGWKPAKAYGFGAGYGTADAGASGFGLSAGMDVDAFGIGYGRQIKDGPLSIGLNVLRVEADVWITDGESSISASAKETLFNLGFLYKFEQPEKAPIRLGLLVSDVTDESNMGPQFSLGVAWPVAPQWLVAVDVLDVTDESDDGPYFSGGVEYSLAETPWKFRAGLADTGDGHDLTLGAGYNFGNKWRVDAAWQNADYDDVWSIGAGFSF